MATEYSAKFSVGDKVHLYGDEEREGEVLSVFKNKRGLWRYVVEFNDSITIYSSGHLILKLVEDCK